METNTFCPSASAGTDAFSKEIDLGQDVQDAHPKRLRPDADVLAFLLRLPVIMFSMARLARSGSFGGELGASRCEGWLLWFLGGSAQQPSALKKRTKRSFL